MKARTKILIVDDRAVNRKLLKILLSRLNLDCIEADCGQTALEHCGQHDFAVVLLDVNLPDISGYTVAKQIRKHPYHGHVPIIFLSAHYCGQQQHRDQGYAAGAVDYLPQPVDATLLISKVQVFVKLWQYSAKLKSMLAEMTQIRQQLEQEIAQRKKTEQHLQQVGHLDPLTKLYNRLFFDESLAIELSRSKRHHLIMAVLFMDLNSFKWINDNLGHSQGDMVLCEISRRLQQCIRVSDVLCRYGGDEFVILMNDVRTCEDIMALVRRIQNTVNQPIALAQQAVQLDISIGVACYPNDGNTADELLNHADKAMYQVKNNHKQQITLNCGQPMAIG